MKVYEIIWHGRGGQGVVIASQILAESAYLQGFKGVTSAPTFGPERRGAPLTASTRISDAPIRTFAQIERPDVAVVLDASLIKAVNIPATMKEGGLLIVNTPVPADELDVEGPFRVAAVDAAGIAFRHHLIREGAPIVNTPLLGAFSRASGIVALEFIERGLRWKLTTGAAANVAALKDAYEATVLSSRHGGIAPQAAAAGSTE
jgi:2-oxoacid:acceptor oxidoreductase gamma subunit (pyruvate/2-ketoisovalerate family)